MAEFDFNKLKDIFRDYHTATHIGLDLLDTSMCERLAINMEREGLCRMIRQDPDIDARCHQCDIDSARKCSCTQEPLIYQCHAGLTECIIPVIDNGRILCYIMFGQILTKENLEEQRRHILQYCSSLGFDKRELAQKINHIPVHSLEEIRANCILATSLVLFITNKKMIKPDKSRFLEMLDRYIDQHISEQITIADLCQLFHISRSGLYKISKPFLNCKISEYITAKRIMYAQKLLATTSSSITQIASLSGFSDFNYFARVFRQRVGQSAKEFRMQSRSSDLQIDMEYPDSQSPANHSAAYASASAYK